MNLRKDHYHLTRLVLQVPALGNRNAGGTRLALPGQDPPKSSMLQLKDSALGGERNAVGSSES